MRGAGTSAAAAAQVWRRVDEDTEDASLQINYLVTDPLFSNRQVYPTFYRIIQDDRVRYTSVIKCLKHFGWNWVGMITPSDGSGDTELQELSKMMSRHAICIEFIMKLTDKAHINKQRMLTAAKKSSSDVIIICGHFSLDYLYVYDEFKATMENKTLILHDSWTNFKYMESDFFSTVNCSLIFILPSKTIPNLDTFIDSANPSTRPNDPMIEDIWLQVFHCLSPNPLKNIILECIYNFSGRTCSGLAHMPPLFSNIKDSKPFYAYTSVYVMAQALHRMKLSKDKLGTNKSHQLLRSYMRRVHHSDSTGAEIFFNDKAEVPNKLILANIVIYKNETDYRLLTVPLLAFNKTLDEDDDDDIFSIELNNVSWKNAIIPESRCNERCPRGYRKVSNGSTHVCCYECIPCSEGEVSNVTDSESCHRCHNKEWPDERKVTCVPKVYYFLSYKNDVIVTIFSLSALLFSAITMIILLICIYYWDTPVVKANNRTVSFILLTSILLSFLCVFLFLGRPVDITCMLRQMSFGIFFSIAVSSVLAKTIIVCIAFKATKPGSSWRKWVGVRVAYFVCSVCSSVQVVICVIWLSVSPPYQEYDMDSYPGKILIQCNEGSVIGFYSVLGYMGFLAAVSFVLAFMVRTLPDSFNEAKYITFSMLVFCSVWIAMIPAYLSTRGKYMVAVEVFAILASSAGILGCIFFPKIYILFFKPEINSRKIMLVKKN
ncbi:vomeronasal type-2 receptor 26-like [Aquarana catesbeiana]|uniref:vomeronasal type-2 receptor 26-like n=1 Tax=Aquarana catesbeiana TaxID=8400 RepID=UPI003CC94742